MTKALATTHAATTADRRTMQRRRNLSYSSHPGADDENDKGFDAKVSWSVPAIWMHPYITLLGKRYHN